MLGSPSSRNLFQQIFVFKHICFIETKICLSPIVLKAFLDQIKFNVDVFLRPHFATSNMYHLCKIEIPITSSKTVKNFLPHKVNAACSFYSMKCEVHPTMVTNSTTMATPELIVVARVVSSNNVRSTDRLLDFAMQL